MDILKHSIHKAIYDLCLEIENLPASDQQTKIVVMAGALHENADRLIDALRDAVQIYRHDCKEITVTEERIEAWEMVAEWSRPGART